MQVDCAGVSLLMTGSPHTSMPIATHHFKPRPPSRGFFYVQDKVRPGTGREGALGYERYIAESTWMCGAIVSVSRGVSKMERRVSVSHDICG